MKQARYQEEYGLPAYDAGILTESRHLAGLFEETAAIYGNAKKTANWFMGEVLRLTKDKAMDPEQVSFTEASCRSSGNGRKIRSQPSECQKSL